MKTDNFTPGIQIILMCACLCLSTNSVGAASYKLGTTNLVVGPSAGADCVVLAVCSADGAWTATANEDWLHLSLANQSGTGSTNVVFSFDANTNKTRVGTLSIGNQTLFVTQAGSSYANAGTPTIFGSPNVLPVGSRGGLYGIALDNGGNVYTSLIYESSQIPLQASTLIEEWIAQGNSMTDWGPSSANGPTYVAVDSSGNVYTFDGSESGTVEKSTPSDPGSFSPVFSGISGSAQGLAVDDSGNIYVADTGNNAIEEWIAATNSLVTLVYSNLSGPRGVALDVAGNVYIADSGNNAIKEWIAANGNVITLVSNGLSSPQSVAADSGGNVYIADTQNNAIKQWSAVSNSVSILFSSGLSYPSGVAVDQARNVYCSDFSDFALHELPRLFVDLSTHHESVLGGSDTIAAVLPTTANLNAPFAPTNDQSWLFITGVSETSISFNFPPAFFLTNSTAHLLFLGQAIPITVDIGTPPSVDIVPMPGTGMYQLNFTNYPKASFSILSSTDLTLPLCQWTILGAASNVASTQYQFTSPPKSNDCQLFYVVKSP